MHVISLHCDNLPPLFFDALPATWVHDKATAKKFATEQEAESFKRVWKLSDGAAVERA